MKNNTRLMLLLAALGLAGASPARAADFYAGAALGQSSWKVEQVPGFTYDRRDSAGKIFGGWRFTPNLAAELGYAKLGRETITGTLIPGEVTVRGDGLFIDLVGTVPVATNFSLLARLGAFHGRQRISPPLYASNRDKSTRPKGGLGIEYAFNPQVALRAEWERYRFDTFGDKGDVDLASVGVSVRF